MKPLHLTLKKEWFDKIKAKQKPEEYRDLKPYWIKRLLDINAPEEEKGENKVIPEDIIFDIKQGFPWQEVLVSYYSKLREFDYVIAKNGYSGGAPIISWKHEGITIGPGKPEYGGDPNKLYFILKIGELQ